jgi:hypothetical protein
MTRLLKSGIVEKFMKNNRDRTINLYHLEYHHPKSPNTLTMKSTVLLNLKL